MESLDIIQARHKALQEEYARTREEAKRAYLAMKADERAPIDPYVIQGQYVQKYAVAWAAHEHANTELFIFEARNGL